MFLGPQGKAFHRSQDWLAKAMPQEVKDLEAKQRAETVQATMRGRVTKALYTKECVDPLLAANYAQGYIAPLVGLEVPKGIASYRF